MRLRSLYACLALVVGSAALSACGAADAATVATATLAPAATSADSCAFSLTWSLVKANASGAPTGYLVKFTTPSATLATDTASAPPVRVALLRPAAPDSVIVTGSVAAMRGTLVFAASSASAVCRSNAVPLPAPDSVKLDTANIVSAIVRPDSLRIVIGDSAMATMYYAMKSGDTVPAFAPVAWSSSDTLIAAVHPIASGPSTWVIASPAIRTGMTMRSLMRFARAEASGARTIEDTIPVAALYVTRPSRSWRGATIASAAAR